MKTATAVMALFLLVTSRVQGTVISVSPGESVQAAIAKALPGDVVHLKPGVHRERVTLNRSGELNKPITLEGEAGAILDGSETSTLVWTPAPDIAQGTYRAKVHIAVFTLIADGKIVTMLREDRVKPNQSGESAQWDYTKLFKEGVKPSGWDGVKALALYRKSKNDILVRFKDNLDPRTLSISFSPKEPVVHMAGASRCTIRGLTLRNAAYGVLLENSVGAVVEDCVIGPTDYGVWLGPGSDRCTVRFNEIFMAPYAGADPQGKGAWENWLAHKRGGHYDRMGVEIYKTRGGHQVHDNYIHDHWDGIEDRGGDEDNIGLRIHHNRLFNLSDDGLEPNGGEVDCQWNDNFIQRSICGFRIKAPTTGPLFAYRNIFWDNKEDFRNYGEVELKPAQVYVYHNTCTAPAAISSNKVFGIGTPNYHYYNNLFWCNYWWGQDKQTTAAPNWKSDYNVFVQRSKDRRWQSGKDLAAQLSLELDSKWSVKSPGFVSIDKADFALSAESPARSAGGNLAELWQRDVPGLSSNDSPDAGAVSYGKAMPTIPRKRSEVQVPVSGSWPP